MRCRTIDEIAYTMRIHLKYLFNFHVFRVNFSWEEYSIQINVSPTNATVKELDSLLPHEVILHQAKRPMHWTDPGSLSLPDEFSMPPDEEAKLWGWRFERLDCQLVISLLSGKSKYFSGRDATFIKLVAESLESKLLELCLFRVLDKKNQVISNINQQQQEVIRQRTSEIAAKNEKLVEISIMNAHQVREPLSRILGLISLVDFCKTPEQMKLQVLPRLKQSAADLDETLKEVITKATAEVANLKA